MTYIPNGIPHESVFLSLGTRRIELTVALMDPTDSNMSADAFIDFDINRTRQRDSRVIASRTPLGRHDYIGAIDVPIASEDFFPTVRDVVFTALKSAGERHASSAWINVGNCIADLCTGTIILAYTALLEGVKEYAVYVKKEQPETHIGEIIFGANGVMHGALYAYSEVSGGFFPTTIFPQSMFAPIIR